MNSFWMASLNNTASVLFLVAAFAFIMFSIHGIIFYKHALIIAIIAGLISFLTPNKEEREEFFKAKGTDTQHTTNT